MIDNERILAVGTHEKCRSTALQIKMHDIATHSETFCSTYPRPHHVVTQRGLMKGNFYRSSVELIEIEYSSATALVFECISLISVGFQRNPGIFVTSTGRNCGLFRTLTVCLICLCLGAAQLDDCAVCCFPEMFSVFWNVTLSQLVNGFFGSPTFARRVGFQPTRCAYSFIPMEPQPEVLRVFGEGS